MRVIEAVELVACHVFNLAEQTRQRLTFGDVERYLAPAGQSSTGLHIWPLCAGAQGDSASGLCDRQRLAMSDQGDQDTGGTLTHTEGL